MRKLVLSTGNKNKVKEIKDILKDLPILVLSKDDVGLLNFDVIEDGSTLEENSLKKARELSKLVDYMVMADDSGIFVDALGGEPGVFSARYGGEDGNDELNNITLLKNLEGKERTASFQSVIALITEDKMEYTVKGICKGRVLEEPQGDNGFGYDPLFVPDGYDKTFAQLDGSIKNTISHRRRAIDELRDKLIEILGEKDEGTNC